MTIMARIREAYPGLSRSQKRIADYLLQFPDKACFLSLKSLSEQVQTTEVTVMNFARRVGYDSFISLKKDLQAYISNRLSPTQKVSEAFSDNWLDVGSVAARVYEMDLQAIKKTFDCITQSQVDQAVELLKSAGRIHLAAQRISQVVADFIFFRLQSLGCDIRKFGLEDEEMIATQMLSVKPGDVFVLIGFPRYSKRLLFLGELLHYNGNRIISITDRMASPVAKYAEVSFACANETLVFYNSLAAPLLLANILVSSFAVAVEERYRVSKAKVQEFDQLREQILSTEEQKKEQS